MSPPSPTEGLTLSTTHLRLRCQPVPWDRQAFGFPVAQLVDLQVGDLRAAASDYQTVREWLHDQDIRILSCRLPHDQLRESMFLEDQGLRFVEMVLHPQLSALDRLSLPPDSLTITEAGPADLPALETIAGAAFRHERYHVDPRLDPRLGDVRYVRWVRNTIGHPLQRLLQVQDDSRLVAFFIVEVDGEEAYWHLTAVAPEWQGQGYGRRAWQAMLHRHQCEGAKRICTTISASNTRVLNLYARLGFGFQPPSMTFHWVRDA